MTGRARGRARGRPRGGANDTAEPARVGAPAPKPAAPSQGNGAPQQPPQTGSGRASHRGGARADARPGENKAAAVSSQMAAMSLTGSGDERRPFRGDDDNVKTRSSDFDKRGSSGSKVSLVSNYFRLKQSPDWQLYQYHVGFSPEVESKGLRMRLVKDHAEMLGPTRAFDGMVLFLAKRLPENKTEVFSTRRSDNEQIRITFQLTNELPPDSPSCIQMYNVIFRRLLSMIDMQQIGRHFYNPKQGVTIQRHKLEVWPGFITGICQYESSVMLCAEISHKILRSDTVLDIMYEMYETARGNFHDMVAKKFVGEIVLTPYNNKTYRVDDIDWGKNPSFKFKKRDTEMDLVSYYKAQYNLDIKDAQQPLLISMPKARDQKRGRTDPILLVPELCRLTGLSEEARKDFTIMKDLATHTRVDPNERHQKLSTFINTLGKNEDVRKELAGWKMAFDNQLLSIQGRTLNAEKIAQKSGRSGNVEFYTISQSAAEWSRQVSRDYQFITSINLDRNRWVVLNARQDEDLASNFITTLKRVGGPMGMQVGDPVRITLQNDTSNTFDQNLQKNIREDTLMVVCIVPNNRKDRYDAIKKRCCLLTPVPSQVIVSRTLKKNIMSVVSKIAIQLNCKLGGQVWGVEIPIKGLMVVGMDCYHDSARKGRSVGAFVASTNKNLTKYYSRCNMQMNTQELLNGLKVNMRNALRKYHDINGELPTQIAIYRDGVGDGQLASVVEQEVPQILESFKTIGDSYSPKMSVIVVKKRINARFFQQAQRNLQNPGPGTIIDSDVTRPEWYDFFLISQSVRQGTVTPTHYNVIFDKLGMPPDRVQRLTYKLTHLYYNWPGTIRVPAPCQYAHKMAFLVGQSLHDTVENDLCDKLFYL